jgi:tetratricopeptide (TPR) repeat protein
MRVNIGKGLHLGIGGRFHILLLIVSSVGFGSVVMAQKSESGKSDRSLPAWNLPPDVSSQLDYAVDRLNSEMAAHVGDYKKARDIQQEIVRVYERYAGTRYYLTVSERATLDEMNEAVKFDSRQQEHLREALKLIAKGKAEIRASNGDAALVHLAKAEKLLSELLKPDGAMLIECHQVQVFAYLVKHDWATAKLRADKAISSLRKTYGEDHPTFLNEVGLKGLFLVMNGESDKAEPLLRRVVEDIERLGGRSHKGVSQNLLRLSQALRKQKKLAEAETACREALSLSEHRDLKKDPTAKFCLSEMANIYSEQGKYKEAEEFLDRALALNERTFGEESLDVLSNLEQYVKLLRDEKRTDDANRMDDRAKKLRARLAEKGQTLDQFLPLEE